MEGELARVVHLPVPAAAPDPDAVFAEMLAGWRRLQLSQGCKDETINGRGSAVMRFADLSGHFPWEWTISDVDDVFAHARSVQNLAQSTVRAYQTAVKLFCDFLPNPRYDWNEFCGRTFGASVSQVVAEFNRARHVQWNEQQSQQRSFKRRELHDFFDLADLGVERVIDSHRKGAVTAYRDAVAFKNAYSWGLRANETTHPQIVDFSRNPHAPQFVDFAVLQVRFGKSQKGSPPKRRSVLTVFEWSAQTVHEWIRAGSPPAESATVGSVPDRHRPGRAEVEPAAPVPVAHRQAGVPGRPGPALVPPVLRHASGRVLRVPADVHPEATRPRTRLDDVDLHARIRRLSGPRAKSGAGDDTR